MENHFKYFGYETQEPCQICGAKPAKMEPRFGYIVCEEHSKLTPIGVSDELEKKK